MSETALKINVLLIFFFRRQILANHKTAGAEGETPDTSVPTLIKMAIKRMMSRAPPKKGKKSTAYQSIEDKPAGRYGETAGETATQS